MQNKLTLLILYISYLCSDFWGFHLPVSSTFWGHSGLAGSKPIWCINCSQFSLVCRLAEDAFLYPIVNVINVDVQKEVGCRWTPGVQPLMTGLQIDVMVLLISILWIRQLSQFSIPLFSYSFSTVMTWYTLTESLLLPVLAFLFSWCWAKV